MHSSNKRNARTSSAVLRALLSLACIAFTASTACSDHSPGSSPGDQEGETCEPETPQPDGGHSGGNGDGGEREAGGGGHAGGGSKDAGANESGHPSHGPGDKDAGDCDAGHSGPGAGQMGGGGTKGDRDAGGGGGGHPGGGGDPGAGGPRGQKHGSGSSGRECDGGADAQGTQGRGGGQGPGSDGAECDGGRDGQGSQTSSGHGGIGGSQASQCDGGRDGQASESSMPPSSSTADLQIELRTASCGSNLVSNLFRVINKGTFPVRLSDISIKFWAYDTSGVTLVARARDGGIQGAAGDFHPVSGVSAKAVHFAPACGSGSGNQANWEITISTNDHDLLKPGAEWSHILVATSLASCVNFSPGAAAWYTTCEGGTYAPDPNVAVYDKGSLVNTQGVVVPVCRTQEFLQIQDFIDTRFYSYGDIVYSFQTALRQPIDCIDFSAQHSVKAMLAKGETVPTAAPPLPTPTTPIPPPHVDPSLAFNGQLDPTGNTEACPSGTVPTHRPTVADVEAAGGLAAYQQAVAHPPRLMGSPSTVEHDCWLNPEGSPGLFLAREFA